MVQGRWMLLSVRTRAVFISSARLRHGTSLILWQRASGPAYSVSTEDTPTARLSTAACVMVILCDRYENPMGISSQHQCANVNLSVSVLVAFWVSSRDMNLRVLIGRCRLG